MKAAYVGVPGEKNLQTEAADAVGIVSMSLKDSSAPSAPLLAGLVYCPGLNEGFISAFMLPLL